MTNTNLLSLLFTYFIVSSLCFLAICNAADSDEHEYNYDEGSSEGPEKWGSLTSEWKTCSNGKSQSPINIDTKKTKAQASDLKKAYKEAPAKISNEGHAIVVEWDGDAGGIEVNGSTYKLVQCHWHTPSEHTIDGKQYDAELHYVHKNEKDQLAVVGILYEVGDSDPFLENAIKDKIKALDKDGNDLGKIIAAKSSSDKNKFFRYFGSLTTPPCSEGVIWTVAEDIKSISKDQIQLLKGPLEKSFQENARPVQDLNGRIVTVFEVKEDDDDDDDDDVKEDSDSSGADSSIFKLRNGIIIATMLNMARKRTMFDFFKPSDDHQSQQEVDNVREDVAKKSQSQVDDDYIMDESPRVESEKNDASN
ncbi:alpha carbonic anhydrase 4-like [Rutidosis leptorrhynchoides]|uniref:alpha carbonic anhydrase 4-like n=1 Tax=Rutidosis leptorrhynchoides TaxID=125765 RepID=UPI003A99BD7E